MHEPIFFTLLDIVSPRGIIRNNSIIKSTQLHVDNSRRIVWVYLKKKNERNDILFNKKNIRLKQPGSKQLYISSLFECSLPKRY